MFGIIIPHDDIIKWKHFPRYWPFVRGIHWSPVNSPHSGQWCGALMFSLICAWINGRVNNRETGDLRCHCTHYDIFVMSWLTTHWFYFVKLGNLNFELNCESVTWFFVRFIHGCGILICFRSFIFSTFQVLIYEQLFKVSVVLCLQMVNFTFYPSALRAGGVLSSRSGRAAAKLAEHISL